MEFDAIILNEKYIFSQLKKNMFLISGPKTEYILYKSGSWHCADEISQQLLLKLGEAIEEHQYAAH